MKYSFLSIAKVAVINLLIVALLLEILLRVWCYYFPSLEVLRFVPHTLRTSIVKNPYDIPRLKDGLKRLYDHPDLGWTHRPGKRIGSLNKKSTITEEGFHTPDNPTPSEQQLLVLGDSFLEGLRTPTPLAWELRDLIGIPLYNMAVGGWGPGQYLEAFKLYGKGRNANTVAIFSFANDIWDSAKYVKWKSVRPELSYKDLLLKERWYKYSINEGETILDRHSLLYNMIKYTVWKYGPIPEEPTQEIDEEALDDYNLVKKSDEFFQVDGGDTFKLQLKMQKSRLFLVCKQQDFEDAGYCRILFKDYIEVMTELLNAIIKDGKEPLLVWIPTKERVYYELLAEERQRFFIPTKRTLVDAEQVLEPFAKSMGTKFLDLTRPIINVARQYAKKGEPIYQVDGGHFNAAGCREAARIVYEAMPRDGLIFPRESTGGTVAIPQNNNTMHY